MLVEEQAALRRVATLVARGASPERVFSAAVEEVGRVLPVDLVSMARYEPDRAITFLTSWGTLKDFVPIGRRLPLGGKNLNTIVFETGRSARIDDYDEASGPVGLAVRAGGVRSAVGTPIVVEGHLWGMMAAGSSGTERLPPDTEARLASFTELLATAIANAEARAELASSRARMVAATDEERRRLVRDLHDGVQQRLVSTIITLAHSLKLKVVAEGVESEDEAKILRLLRCDQMQGYLVSRPLPFDDITALLSPSPA